MEKRPKPLLCNCSMAEHLNDVDGYLCIMGIRSITMTSALLIICPSLSWMHGKDSWVIEEL